MEKQKPVKNPNGCPCSTYLACCDQRDTEGTHTPDHQCDKGFCEDCYTTECNACGDTCHCDL